MTKRIGVSCAIVWMAISFLPYPFVGKYWGMSWMLLNYPMSIALKGIGVLEVGYPYVLLGVVTFVNATIYGYVVFCLARLIRFIAQKSRSDRDID
jgi:hypothetical protein